jgi:hypothetical protein
MLDCDRPERRERRRLVQHPLGQVRVQPHPLPLAGSQRARLVPDRVRDTQAPEVVDERGAPQQARLVLGQAEPAGRRRRELRDCAGVPERVRRLEIDEVGDREQRPVEGVFRERDAERRLGLDHRAPGVGGVEPAEDRFRVGAQRLGQGWVELRAGASFRQAQRGVDAADAVGNLDELGELRQPGGERDAVLRQAAGPPLSVPLFVRSHDRFRHCSGQPEPLGQRSRDRRVPSDHPVEVVPAGDRELEPHPKAVQGRIPATDEAHRSSRGSQAAVLVLVLLRAQRDVVPEPLRLLVRVDVTAHVDEQGGVVDGRSLGLIEPYPLGQAQRDHAVAEHVLHRLSEAEIDAERERRDELREPHLRHVDNYGPGIAPGIARGYRGSEPGVTSRRKARSSR